jgi:hypothetical protein
VLGHHVAQLRLVFRIVPHRGAPLHPCSSLFLCYAQRFDIIPQQNQGSPTQGPHVEPTSGMYILKRAKRHDGTILGDVVPLAHVRALVSLIPRFGKEAEKRLTKESSLEHSLEFQLNKYINKEFFYALSAK